MGDRVEENREEQRILEQRLLNQRTDASRQESAKAFAKVVAQVQQNDKHESKTQDNRQQSQDGANAKLLARRGIANNEFSGKLTSQGNARMLKTRGDEARKNGESSLRRILDDKVQERKGGESHNAPVGGVHDRDGRKGGGGKRDDNSKAMQEAKRELIVGNQTGLGVFAMGGAGAKSTSGSTGVAQTHTQMIIDEIVKNVAVHKSALTGLGTVHVELKDNVLSGASLTLQQHDDGLSVKIRTTDDQVKRLLSSGSTAQELSVALQNKGIKLKTLEVNDTKVIR